MYSEQGTQAKPVRQVYFIDEVAARLGTSVSSIRRRLRARTWVGPVPLVSVDKKVRFRRAEVDRWLMTEGGTA